MTLIRRIILAAVLIAGISPATAQVPPPVPALPDSERRTTYSISASTCACNVNFALYGDSTDFANWLTVWVNGVQITQSGNWTITSPSGSLATLPRPITDAVLTFTQSQTGTVQIVGARRPRRTSQFSENAGVSARNLNQVITDLTAQNREFWDKINDITGRVPLGRPGETLALLPVLASRQNMGACFDSGGNLTSCVSVPSSTIISGTGISFSGVNPTTIALNLSAGNGISVSGNVVSSSTQFLDVAAALAANVGNNTIRTLAFATGGVGGAASAPAHWTCSASPPSHLAFFGPTLDGKYCAYADTIVNVGALGNFRNNTDLTPGLNAAYSYCVATAYCELRVPAGNYVIASLPDAVPPGVNGIKICGDAQGLTTISVTLTMDDDHGVFSFLPNANAGYAQVCDMTIVKLSGSGGNAIKAVSGRTTGIVLSGTPVVGQTLTVTIGGVGTTAPYTIVGGDNLHSIATALDFAVRTLTLSLGVPIYTAAVNQNTLYIVGPDTASPAITLNGGTSGISGAVGASSNLNQGFVHLNHLNMTGGVDLWTRMIYVDGFRRTTGVGPCCIREFHLSDSTIFGASSTSILLSSVVGASMSNVDIFDAGGTSNKSLTITGISGGTPSFYCAINLGYVSGISLDFAQYCLIKAGFIAGNVTNTNNTTFSRIEYGTITGTRQYNWQSSQYVTNNLDTLAVAALPACAAGSKGQRFFVNDATVATFNSVAAGGGANGVPVTCDGTNWRIG